MTRTKDSAEKRAAKAAYRQALREGVPFRFRPVPGLGEAEILEVQAEWEQTLEGRTSLPEKFENGVDSFGVETG